MTKAGGSRCSSRKAWNSELPEGVFNTQGLSRVPSPEPPKVLGGGGGGGGGGGANWRTGGALGAGLAVTFGAGADFLGVGRFGATVFFAAGGDLAAAFFLRGFDLTFFAAEGLVDGLFFPDAGFFADLRFAGTAFFAAFFIMSGPWGEWVVLVGQHQNRMRPFERNRCTL